MKEGIRNSVTLVLPYYDNPTMLHQQFNDVRALPVFMRDLVHVVVVDDASPRWTAHFEDLAGVALQIYRIRDDVRWNQDAARNIGVAHAETNWLLLTDIDHRVPLATWQRVLTRELDESKVYQFRRVSAPDMQPYKLHPNSWLMTRKVFDKAGGYDERFAGYYGTDSDFRDRVKAVAETTQLKEHLIRVPRAVVPDASTTTYLRKQPEDGPAIARIKAKRALDPAWVPLRGRFAYDRVHP